MKMKRIGGILIGTSAVLATTLVLASCGGADIDFKSYKTEATQEEFEKAYASFIEENKTTHYDLTVYDFEESNQKVGDQETKIKSEATHIETYDAKTAVLYTYDKDVTEGTSPASNVNINTEVEKIYQTNDGLNTIINITAGTYTSAAYNASSVKTKTSSVFFDNYVDYEDYKASGDAYTTKYYNDDSVYTAVITYDASKDTEKEKEVDGVKIVQVEASYELTFQFFGIDSEYFIGYELKTKYTTNSTSGSVTTTTKYEGTKAKYARLFKVEQSIDPFDLTKYKKDYSSYAE